MVQFQIFVDYNIVMFAVHGMAFSNETSGRTKQQKTGEEVYFEGSKKNQLNDLKKYLKTIVSDPQKEFYRRALIEKIISYTTAGIDTSRLYPEIVLASATKDTRQKKLIYLYLSIYSHNNQQFARMAINTYLKDLSSPNPNVRTLAARSLSNLRFKGRQQYALPAFHTGLNDFVPSVKRSCLLGLVKIAVEHNRTTPNQQRDQSLLSKFYQLLREEDSTLVCTALEAINEVQEQGISMSRKLTYYLISNLHKFNDMQLPVVIGYLELYQPKNDQEIMDILVPLQTKLKSSNSATVLAISKVFLKMASLKQEFKDKILKTLRKSLLSFLHNEVPQIEYIILIHIEYIISVIKTDVFSADYKKFMIGGQQPSYLKSTKITILRLCTSKQNFADIVNQFAQYLFDEVISRNAVEALAELLFEATEVDAKFIAKTMVKNVETAPLPLICNNVLPLVNAYLRLYPKEFSLFGNIFYTLVDNAKDEDSKCSILQLVGDFGQFIEDAPQLININHQDISDRVKISLLRATTKLFLKRPKQTINNLTTLLKNILSDDQNHLHIKDYASYIYRGLQAGVVDFKRGFLQERPHQMAVKFQPEKLQFNSLQVIYRAKVEKWGLDPLKYIQVDQIVQGTADQNGEVVQTRQIHVDLSSKFQKLQVQNFDVTFTMTSEQFQKSWEEYDIGSSITRVVNNMDVLSEQNLQQLFRVWNITVLASAQTEQQIKFYTYCRIQTNQKYLGIACMECCFHKLPETITLMIKSDDDELAGFVSRYLEQILRLNQII